MAGSSRRTSGAKSSSIKSIKAKIPDDWEEVLKKAAEEQDRKKRGQKWTDEQIVTLKKYYNKVPEVVLAKTIGVTVGRLKYKREKLISKGELKPIKRVEV